MLRLKFNSTRRLTALATKHKPSSGIYSFHLQNKFIQSQRFQSTTNDFNTNAINSDSKNLEELDVNKTVSSAPQPWYLTMVKREKLVENNTILEDQVVKYPENSPGSLISIIEMLKTELGLTDILIFDLREKETNNEYNYPTAAAKISDFMVLSTAQSTKHCEKCFVELNKMMKQKFNSIASVEGNINSNDERKKQKRLARKRNLERSSLAKNPTTSTSRDSWYLVDCHLDNIFVNILTKNRRKELNLEELYAPKEEREKYRYDNSRSDLELSDEYSSGNNILSGLRKIALQRRRAYSTLANPSQLSPDIAFDILKGLNKDNLHIKLKELDQLKSASSLTDIDTLNFLSSAAKQLSNKQEKKVYFKGLQKMFESQWPLIIPRTNSDEFWSARSNFYKSCFELNPQQFSLKDYFINCLLIKRVSGFKVEEKDLINFFNILSSSLLSNEKSNYWNLIKSNNLVVSALNLIDDERIIKNSQFIDTLLNTMIIDENKHSRALYEIVDYLVYNSERSNKALEIPMITIIINALCRVQNWSKLWQFWDILGKNANYRNDFRPWAEYLRLINKNGNETVHRKIIEDGQLLWIVRNDVPLTKELTDQLSKFFSLSNDEGIETDTVKELILNAKPSPV
ncbi:hypothetical protein Kpol_467p13 [Vanderwaltozyma polyspora DSM 70294]|uniref:ATPase synthesis protein 25, mitochondrial n=1 Tax=Vanderwaltozyma polyspora (strain ATCC 22028 / DSM 70294 / BCRC 21397 / CBS 2163 / NBRC 10782 / NRRL Y-8283 / UCD 57-17) TaxID=436907 RepID=ATP25_VANPO|nr:uncharacterized protein Kpol_467p13 [Vanderwaltozyma polyspora DSM 70294]A7TQF7.1 RecName: Full=ATPase synthesis protein 25, mitochondrial; Flags: Precursor [Vanderwaltozyma polyspora DSM 70294]EDO15501.1 hypothetical protein Kpol_467p13 [Vanderwaltozyma polyspora DSM 70294]